MRINPTTTLAGMALALALGTSVLAQERGIGAPPPAEVVMRMTLEAQTHLKQGEESFTRGDFDHARSQFDDALDVFLSSSFDMRSDAALQTAYRDTLERVHRYETIGVNAEGDSVWPMQAYEVTSEDFRPEDVPTDDQVTAAEAGQFRDASFLVRLGEMQRRFRAQFGRDFTLTGRDTQAHTRLYGHGNASDIRVSDLSGVQVRFIVDQGRALRMRVLDFSTADRVAAHNARVLVLGRPLDTLATGMHLHLNDLPRRATYVETPAVKRRVRGAT